MHNSTRINLVLGSVPVTIERLRCRDSRSEEDLDHGPVRCFGNRVAFDRTAAAQQPRGVARVDDRRNVLKTGSPWRDLPSRYGPYTTAYNRYNL